MPEETFRNLMEHAILTPTAFNIQSWRFYVISAERRIKHPAVSAITEAARTGLFG